ncbi:MAG: DUF1800 domain-containing protein [Anaerolineales bacterium]
MRNNDSKITRRQFLTGMPIFNDMPGVQLNKSTTTTDPDLHLLNRISWGPRPDEVARIKKIGREAYLEEQLAPEVIVDKQAESRLKSLPILNMDRAALYSFSEVDWRCQLSLTKGMILRAVHSKRQLLERMVEFWADHFNIIAMDEFAIDSVVYQRQAIRAHTLGNFRDMLIETAKSPAMIYYLDNFNNVAEHPNENYARELLELHTLGVDGGYTETDVKEAARALTGWTVHNKTRTGFYFDLAEHDQGEKTILGHRFPAGRGIEDGLHLLSLLANHPQTARFVCTKLCVRFVSDNLPRSLVESLARVWMANQGEIKPVLRHLFLSAEFQNSVGAKFRRPLDFFIGALRATGTDFVDWWPAEEMLTELGQIPYNWGPPDGYPDTAESWIFTNGVLARWNTAMRLTHGAYSDPDWGWGLSSQLRERIGNPDTVGELVDAVSEQVFGKRLEGESRHPFVDYASDGSGPQTSVDAHLLARKLGSLFGLMLASPLYQWR